MVSMYHSFLIHSSADGHLGCFHVLAMINSAVMNIVVHASQIWFPQCVCPEVGLLGHMAVLFPLYIQIYTNKQTFIYIAKSKEIINSKFISKFTSILF